MTDNTTHLKGDAPKITELVAQGYAKKPENAWPIYGGGNLARGNYMTSSQAGNCERMIWFGQHTDEFEPEQEAGAWGFWERGHNVEAWVVEQLERSGLTCMFTGDLQRSFVSDNQSGTPDGLVKWNGEWFCLEIKSIDPRTNVRNLPKKAHVIQTQQNMDLMSQNLIEGYNIRRSLLYYVNASDYSKSYDFVIDADSDVQEELCQKADRISVAKAPEEMTPEGIYNGGCQYCTFKAYCSEVVKQKNEMSKDEAIRKSIADRLF